MLWDNYSLTRYGDPRPYGQMNQFKLYDVEGQVGGLTLRTSMMPKPIACLLCERKHNRYENLETVKNFPEGMDFNNAKITWEGDIEPSETGTYRFLLYYAGYQNMDRR